MKIIGISAYYHDSAVALIHDGEILFAAEEERFTRKKGESSFPSLALQSLLTSTNTTLDQIDAIIFYEKPLLKFERLLETYLAFAPKGYLSFRKAIPIWLKEKLFLKSTLRQELKKIAGTTYKGEILFSEHHLSHAASAFYPSPFKEALILTIDGVGEWATTTIAIGKENRIESLEEIHFPHSLGLLYSAITYYTGFKVNSGEYKVMGLAPYGEPTYVHKIKKHLIDIKVDGSFALNMEYFDFATGLTMTNKKFNDLFGGPPRVPETKLTQKEMDLARSIQDVTEEIILKIVTYAKSKYGLNNLVLSGGVALNCVANGKILKNRIFDSLWIQPAAGDAGGALGAALLYYHHSLGKIRMASGQDKMRGTLLGPQFNHNEIKHYLDSVNADYRYVENDEEFINQVATSLADGKIIGWHQGKMEFGPRALGSRSILGDPRRVDMQKNMNLKIKFRESFRPFAPAVLFEDTEKYFDLKTESPYMLLIAEVQKSRRVETQKSNNWGIDRVNEQRSDIPSVTHLDYTARVQTVDKERNERFHELLSRFKKKTGFSLLINTSFNVRGEPIVCTPEDSYRCFMNTAIDVLAIGNFILEKEKQPPFKESTKFELD